MKILILLFLVSCGGQDLAGKITKIAKDGKKQHRKKLNEYCEEICKRRGEAK